MASTARLAGLLAACCVLHGAAAADRDVPIEGAPPGYVSTKLANGLEVSILPDPAAPIVATQVWYHVGSANEDAGSRGLAHLFEHLMFGATRTHGKEDYERLHHRFGGDENAYTSPDETVYVSEITPEGHAGVLALEADRMRGLVISEENLANERKIVTEELRLRTENDPMSRLFVEAQKQLLGSHPYAFSAVGEKEDVAAATVASCRSFYDRYYHPDGAHLVIVGPVNTNATLAAIERAFGPLEPGATRPADVPSLLGWKFPEEVDLHEDLPPVEVAAFGFPLPDGDAPDRAALDVLLEMLSGGAVDLFREELVTRRHKALEAGSESLRMRRGGALFFYSASLPYRRKSTAFRAMEQTIRTLDRLEWLTPERLASAKRSLRRTSLIERYYPARRADAIGEARWHEGDERFAFDRESRIDAVTLDGVKAAWRSYLGEAKPVRLYARPDHVPILVRLFGWIYPLID
jgi:zinc protease